MLVPCTVGGRDVMVKRLYGPDAPWRWYVAREIAQLRAFALEPPPVRAPSLVAGDPACGILVMERLPGRPLASRRHDPSGRQTVPDETWAALLEAHRAIAGWARGLALSPEVAPDRATVRAMRERLLEDPSAPLAWVIDGLERCASRGLIDSKHTPRFTAAITRAGVGFQHGDLLLRNVLVASPHLRLSSPRPVALSIADWECAGPHPKPWDAALLWVWAPAWARRALRADHEPDAFDGCVAFALAREISYRRSRGRGDPVCVRLRRELDTLLTRV
jgi:hypothetical protein